MGQACDWVEAAMRSRGWAAGDVTRAVLSVGECVSNAVEHGRGPVHLSHDVTEDEARVRVGDEGPGPPRRLLEHPSLPTDALATEGRGLFIVSQLADRVEPDPGGGVRLTFRPRP